MQKLDIDEVVTDMVMNGGETTGKCVRKHDSMREVTIPMYTDKGSIHAEKYVLAYVAKHKVGL